MSSFPIQYPFGNTKQWLAVALTVIFKSVTCLCYEFWYVFYSVVLNSPLNSSFYSFLPYYILGLCTSDPKEVRTMFWICEQKKREGGEYLYTIRNNSESNKVTHSQNECFSVLFFFSFLLFVTTKFSCKSYFS